MPKDQPKEPLSNFGLLGRKNDDEADVEDDEDDEEVLEDGVLFYVNKGGFPINDPTWDRMYAHIAKLHPHGHKATQPIKNNKHLPHVPIPQAPTTFPSNAGVSDRLDMVQKYMTALQYNHTGTQFFEIRKNRPISGLMDCAKDMIKESLPIKCLEAVILSLYLTIGTPALDRFPIGFKTMFNGCIHRHVVLGVYSFGKYGALGMSRREDLMYKPMEYKCLSELIQDFASAYMNYHHKVKKIKVGLPVPHDIHSYEKINWNQLSVAYSKKNFGDLSKTIDRFAREMRTQTKKLDAMPPISNPPPKSKMLPVSSGSPHALRRSSTVIPSQPCTDHKARKARKSDKSSNSSKRRSASLRRQTQESDVLKSFEPSTSFHSDSPLDNKVTVNTEIYQIRV